jgi:hypothetical protein
VARRVASLNRVEIVLAHQLQERRHIRKARALELFPRRLQHLVVGLRVGRRALIPGVDEHECLHTLGRSRNEMTADRSSPGEPDEQEPVGELIEEPL